MFSDLKAITDIVRQASSDVLKIKENKKREEEELNLLKIYFLILDCIDEAELLFEQSGPNPISTIEALPEVAAISMLDRWDHALRRQNVRLQLLRSYLLGQHALTVVNPSVQRQIADVVGSKSRNVTQLFRIGAALWFREIFPVSTTTNERAAEILLLAGSPGNEINLEKLREEIRVLRSALEDYRSTLFQFLETPRVIDLSRRARLETELTD